MTVSFFLQRAFEVCATFLSVVAVDLDQNIWRTCLRCALGCLGGAMCDKGKEACVNYPYVLVDVSEELHHEVL